MNLPPFEYIAPISLDDALAYLDVHQGEPVRILAGGTDLLVEIRRKVIPPGHRPPRDLSVFGGRWTTKAAEDFRPTRTLLALSKITGLSGIRKAGAEIRIGAMTTIRDLERSELIKEELTALWNGACQLGSPLVRNRGTLGGNICNARPAADCAVPALALGARVRLQSISGERELDLEEFILAPGKTAIRQGEILTEVIFPKMGNDKASAYIKLANRKSLEIAVVGAAAWVRFDGEDKIVAARIALGAVGPTPLLARDAAESLIGCALTPSAITAAGRLAAEFARPITDHRGGREYRLKMVEVLVARVLDRRRRILTAEAV